MSRDAGRTGSRCAMNHADFCVMLRCRAISMLLMPFLQFTKSHRATSHLSRPSAEFLEDGAGLERELRASGACRSTSSDGRSPE